MLLSLLAQQMDPIAGGLLQYGAIGVLATASLFAVRLLWKRNEAAYEAERERLEAINAAERQRADRLEMELLALNKLISTELSGNVVRATEIMREVMDLLRHRDRGDR